MQLTTIEGIVKDGKIQVGNDIFLPELSKVYVIIPAKENIRRVMSPRLVNKSDAKIFEKRVEVDFDDEI